MLPDPGVCPSLAKDRAPRCALESFCRRIPVSAHLAGVGLLIAFLSTLGCFVRAPGQPPRNVPGTQNAFSKYSLSMSMNMAEGDTLISVDYEIFGKVQGVFFRKYTQLLHVLQTSFISSIYPIPPLDSCLLIMALKEELPFQAKAFLIKIPYVSQGK
ncbi:acylphosphatase-1 isoform X2 [Panthera tigris]|uniref:acylphosphatase-1 isoform X2 n=1 Tax=Panthera tigris TaxID=9694 RepID=UPI00076637F5|nr:acylphosphatase-1 isoform X2 [Panthera tigris]XP_042799752.1 acylphosphatase-1 isoform X2 [Panthera leo]XP_060476299.1 acylphosphatase-1 isoform X3 [Panthera onca]